jgi:hypothetical protein
MIAIVYLVGLALLIVGGGVLIALSVIDYPGDDDFIPPAGF